MENLANNGKLGKNWNKYLAKKSKFWQKIEILAKNRNFGKKSKFCQNKRKFGKNWKNWNIGKKIEHSAKNRNFCKKTKFCQKTKNLAKIGKLGKNWNIGKKNQTFGKKSKFWQKKIEKFCQLCQKLKTWRTIDDILIKKFWNRTLFATSPSNRMKSSVLLVTLIWVNSLGATIAFSRSITSQFEIAFWFLLLTIAGIDTEIFICAIGFKNSASWTLSSFKSDVSFNQSCKIAYPQIFLKVKKRKFLENLKIEI